MQISNMTRIDVIGDDAHVPKADAFRLRSLKHNKFLTLVSTKVEGKRELKVSNTEDDASLFFIIKSGNCYVFVPCCRQLAYLVDEGGKLNEGTKVLLDASDVPPAQARWAIDRVSLPSRRLKLQDLSKIVSSQYALSTPPIAGHPRKHLRFLPALLDGHKFDPKLSCWEFEKIPGPIRLGEREVEWMIVDAESPEKDTFWLYCAELRAPTDGRFGDRVGFRVQGGIPLEGGGRSKFPDTDLLIGDGFNEFFITESMGYLCFHAKYNPEYSIFAEDAKNGKKLRVGAWNDKYPRSLARWRVIPTRNVEK